MIDWFTCVYDYTTINWYMWVSDNIGFWEYYDFSAKTIRSKQGMRTKPQMRWVIITFLS